MKPTAAVIIITVLILACLLGYFGLNIFFQVSPYTSSSSSSSSSSPLISVKPLSAIEFTRQLSLKNGSRTLPVPVLTVWHSLFKGLSEFNISKNALYNLAKLSVELNPNIKTAKDTKNAYKYKNSFEIATLCIPVNDKKEANEIFYAIKFLTLLCRSDAVLVMDIEHPESRKAWDMAISKNIIREKNTTETGQTFKTAEFVSIDLEASMSVLFLEMAYETMSIPKNSPVKYYCTSNEREEELREAYKNDLKFEIVNITSALNSFVVSCLNTKIKISISNKITDSEKPKIESLLKLFSSSKQT
jgi:hypothetical protein